jgi:adenine/guanine phosphoribosyltransferase-like PRPP-binding protein
LCSVAGITVSHNVAVTAIVRRCYSDVEVRNREGKLGRGFTNLKRIFGWPSDLRLVVGALASTAIGADAVASTDTGSGPLAALIGYQLELPVVFVRREPKDHFLSYGGEPARDNPRLSGERLEHGTRVHLLDDFVHSAATLGSAVEALRKEGLIVQTAAAVVGSPPDTITAAIAALDVDLTILVSTDDLFESAKTQTAGNS